MLLSNLEQMPDIPRRNPADLKVPTSKKDTVLRESFPQIGAFQLSYFPSHSNMIAFSEKNFLVISFPPAPSPEGSD